MTSRPTPAAIRELLDAATGPLDPPPPPYEAITARARRRRRHRVAAGAVGTALLAAAAAAIALVGLPVGGDLAQVRVRPAAPVSPAPSGVAAAELARDRWSALPVGPVPAYQGASVVWTGSRMLVWGGASGPKAQTLHADGASYDPATRSWQRLPAAPIAARAQQAAVWTGRELLIWGGYTSLAPAVVSGTGAAYDPKTGRWRSIAASPLDSRASASAVWTGREMIVLGGFVQTPQGYLQSAAYDPTADRWRLLPPLPELADRAVRNVVAVWAGDRLLVWTEWSHLRTDGFGDSGVDLFSYDPRANRWRHVPDSANAPKGIDTAVWTGRRVVVPGARRYCGGCLGSPPMAVGRSYDPTTNRWQLIDHGPFDDGNWQPRPTWTGRALLAVTGLGDVDAWDPRTGTWSQLARAPYRGIENMVWTGRSLLVWSPLYDARRPTQPVPTAGLQFGPP